MEFHPDRSNPTEAGYVMHKQKLDQVDEAKYLGILIQDLYKKISQLPINK